MTATKEKKFAAFISIISNSSLIALKLVAGFVSGSISIISEAIHSFSDLLASFLAFFSVSRSGEPADEDHPFGHGKYEDLSGLIEGLLIILASFYIIYEAVKKIISPDEHILNTNLAITVMAISVIVNFFVSLYLFHVAKKTDSIALFADAEHLRTDIFSSLAVVIGLLAIKFTGLTILDPLFAIIVAAIILKAGYSICKNTTNNLLDGSLPKEQKEKIAQIINGFASEGVTSFRELQTRKAGMKKKVAITLLFDPQLTVDAAHNICDKVEAEIDSALGNTDVMIHIEPHPTPCSRRETT